MIKFHKTIISGYQVVNQYRRGAVFRGLFNYYFACTFYEQQALLYWLDS